MFNLFEKCTVSIIFANFSILYIIACIFYKVKTYNIGTPFKDSLSEKQLKIKEKSSKQRKKIFYEGLIIGLLILILFKPFE